MRLLLDSGSQKSYISERTQRLLALEATGEQRLSIATFGSNKERDQVCPIIKVGMMTKGDSPMHLSLYVVPMICEPLVSQPIAMCMKESQHSSMLDLADYSDGESCLEVDVLIGSDIYWDLVTGGVHRGSKGPVAIHTKLGWVLSGPMPSGELAPCSMNLVTTHVLRVDAQSSDHKPLEDQLRSFWELESLGIHEPEKTMYDKFTDAVTFRDDGTYEVSLPWREFHNPLPDNYQLSFKRLQGLLRHLKQTPDILQEYDSIIKDQMKLGIVELVPETKAISSLCHYLPHHAVIRSDKTTTKLCIVYDASAKTNRPSLNDCLHKGPKFNQLTLDILL